MARGKIRVLVVDDSAFARINITRQLKADPKLEVVGNAKDGIEALEMVRTLKPDVVTLDIEMPRMDGLTALERIMMEHPTPVVMISSHTHQGAENTVRALALGAVDFFSKGSTVRPIASDEETEEIHRKVRQAARSKVSRLARRPGRIGVPRVKARRRATAEIRKVIVIGCSTGGPGALGEVLPLLPGDLPASLLIVQHMPAEFTKTLAQQLDGACDLVVKEAEEGDRLLAGQVLVAPGDFHMVVHGNGRIVLGDGDRECGVRPSVNVTLESVAGRYGNRCLCVILTGMGSDGTRGAALVREAGGEVWAEDESTCVVYGMPRSVIEEGHADRVLSRPEIAQAIIKACK